MRFCDFGLQRNILLFYFCVLSWSWYLCSTNILRADSAYTCTNIMLVFFWFQVSKRVGLHLLPLSPYSNSTWVFNGSHNTSFVKAIDAYAPSPVSWLVGRVCLKYLWRLLIHNCETWSTCLNLFCTMPTNWNNCKRTWWSPHVHL